MCSSILVFSKTNKRYKLNVHDESLFATKFIKNCSPMNIVSVSTISVKEKKGKTENRSFSIKEMKPFSYHFFSHTMQMHAKQSCWRQFLNNITLRICILRLVTQNKNNINGTGLTASRYTRTCEPGRSIRNQHDRASFQKHLCLVYLNKYETYFLIYLLTLECLQATAAFSSSTRSALQHPES